MAGNTFTLFLPFFIKYFIKIHDGTLNVTNLDGRLTKLCSLFPSQTLTPHMQSADRKEIDRGMGSGSSKSYGRVSSSSDEDQMNFSLDHWKKAFKDACERLCPVRAAGHECGCLRLLSRLVIFIFEGLIKWHTSMTY